MIMNKTIVILNLLVASISVARPTDELTTSKNEKELSKVGEIVYTRSSDGNEGSLSIVIKKDDILSTSDLSKVHNSFESILGKTRYLKEQLENDGFEKPEVKIDNRTTKKSKSVEILKEKPEERSADAGDQSKVGIKEDSKTVETTSEASDFPSTTAVYRKDSKSSGDSRNDKAKVENKQIVSPEEKSEKTGIETINDESNSAWDVLDDISTTRRMLSRPDSLNLDVKGYVANGNTKPMEARKAPLSNLKLSRNNEHQGTMQRSPNPVPHIHQPATRQRHQIVPGYITLRAAVPIDFRRILSEEQNNMIKDRSPYAPTDTLEALRESRNTEDIMSDENSNAYPYTPDVSETQIMPKITPTNVVFTKLQQASEHPHKFVPNDYYNNGDRMKITPDISFANVMPIYTVPQNYDTYKYVTGFGRYPQYL